LEKLNAKEAPTDKEVDQMAKYTKDIEKLENVK